MAFKLETVPWLTMFAITTAIIFAVRMRLKKSKYLPGPKSFSFFGHNALIEKFSQLQLAQWLLEQGPIVRLVLNGKDWIGISSLEIANHLLVKAGNIFSSRPFFPLLSDFVFQNDAIAIMPYGDQWRKHRRFMHNLINPTTVKSMEPMLKQELEVMLNQIDEALKETDVLDITQFIDDYFFRVIVQVLFGNIPVPQTDHENPARVFRGFGHEAFKLLTTPKPEFRNVSPFALNYSDAQLKKATALKEAIGKFIVPCLGEVKKNIQIGKADSSIASQYFTSTNKSSTELEEQEFISFIILLFLAGILTAADNSAWAIAAITKYHDQQVIAHEHLDKLHKFPTLEDSKELLFIQNILKETLRLFPSVPLNIPRESIQDYQYQGYNIPAGSTVVVNLYAINRDPQRYPNPHMFDPSRYSLNAQSTELDPFSFGMGRRLCPGINLAKAEMFYVLSSVLYKYELMEHPDYPIVLSTDGCSLTNPPLQFKVQLKKRNEKAL